MSRITNPYWTGTIDTLKNVIKTMENNPDWINESGMVYLREYLKGNQETEEQWQLRENGGARRVTD